MPLMNFDLQDGLPPVSFNLKDADCERFMSFMAECQAATAKSVAAHAEPAAATPKEEPNIPGLAADPSAFVRWADKVGYDMTSNPIHFLFLNEKTNAARQGWKAACDFYRVAQTAQKEPDPTAQQIQCRNIHKVVKAIADHCFVASDDPKYGHCHVAVINSVTAQDGIDILALGLEPLPSVSRPTVLGRDELSADLIAQDALFIFPQAANSVTRVSAQPTKED